MSRRAVPPPRAGFHLVEVMVVLAVMSAIAALVVPGALRLTAGLRVRLAAFELAGALRTASALAVRRGERVAVKFRVSEDGSVSYRLYRDGDGDGVRNRDIESGVDPPVGLPHQLHHLGAHVRFGFPPGDPPRDPGDPGRRLGRLQDPIRFNLSDLASFGPLGGSTPGSLYLTDSRFHLSAVRVTGATGRIRILKYDPGTQTWRG